jgi:phosphoribosylanthranilate isomerase
VTSAVAKLKICGITRAEDLATCARLGVDAVGINLWSGSKRGLSLEEAERMIEQVPSSSIERVGVFVEPRLDEVETAISRLRLDAIQLHDDRDPEPFTQLGVPWVWVIRGTPSLSELRVPAVPPAWVLLDAMVDGFGGQGRQTDWAWAAEAVRSLSPLAVWLAGGITAANAAEALRTVGPAGLDVASGAEVDDADRGQKDPARIAALLQACRGA